MPAIPNQTPASIANDYAVFTFVVQQILSGVATATLVRVQACTNSGGVSAVGLVDVQLLIDQVLTDGTTIPQGTIFKVPYSRLQGGQNAVILDPQQGDIGICVFASRDISAVKADPAAARDRTPSAGAPPGSARQFNLADGLYIGGVLNGVPTQFIQMSEEGIRMKSPTAVTLEAPQINFKGPVTQTDGDVTMSGRLDVEGIIHSATDVLSDTISGKTHTHPTAAPGPPSPPSP